MATTNNGFNWKVTWYIFLSSVFLIISVFIVFEFKFPFRHISSESIILIISLLALLLIFTLAVVYNGSAIQQLNGLQEKLKENRIIIEKRDMEINRLSKKIDNMIETILKIQTSNATEPKPLNTAANSDNKREVAP